MPIAISHLTEDDLYQRGRRLNSKRLLIESRKKLRYAQDRRDALPSIITKEDLTQIIAQRTLVKELKQQQKLTAQGSQALTSSQESKLDTLIKQNNRLMDLVDLAIRLKMLKGDGYRRGESPGRAVKNWEDITEERLLQAKADKALLMGVGLTDELLNDYEKAINDLTASDDEQESRRPEPSKASRALAIARGKLAYMLIWLCGIAEHTFRDKPEEAKLFLVSDLLRERAVANGDNNGEEDDDTEDGDELDADAEEDDSGKPAA